MIREFLHNNKIFKDRRKELRANQTEAEKLLWYRVRNRQIIGLKFFRQYSLSPYILDFYCPKIKLAIELDGSQHAEADAALYDKERERYLEAVGIRVVRFWNNEVLQHIEKVVEKIVEESHNSLDPSYLKREGRAENTLNL